MRGITLGEFSGCDRQMGSFCVSLALALSSCATGGRTPGKQRRHAALDTRVSPIGCSLPLSLRMHGRDVFSRNRKRAAAFIPHNMRRMSWVLVEALCCG